jgi:hypothetical protein
VTIRSPVKGVPADLVQSKFGNFFSIGEKNTIVAKNANGEQIYSRANPGNVADFDEALQSINDAYLYKDSILKGTSGSGGVTGGNNGAHAGQRLCRANLLHGPAISNAIGASTAVNFSPTIIITTESLGLVLILLRLFHVL